MRQILPLILSALLKFAMVKLRKAFNHLPAILGSSFSVILSEAKNLDPSLALRVTINFQVEAL